MAASQFLSVENLPRLTKAIGEGNNVGKTAPTGFGETLGELGDQFGNARFLARTYNQSHCQNTDPADEAIESQRRSLFATVDEFLSAEPAAGAGPRGRQMFVLGDAGMGKTSLLVMLKLMQAAGLWPKHHRCELMRIGADTLAQIEKIKAPRKTVLLLDGLNSDAFAAENLEARVAELLQASAAFHRVIITCRSQYHPEGRACRFDRVGRLAGDGYGCPTIYLSPFIDAQVDKYLKRRFRRMEEPNRKRAKGVLSGMGSMKFRPLLLSAADDFVHSVTKTWNEVAVYEAMFEAWLDREQHKATRAKGRDGVSFDRDALREGCIKVARLMALSKDPGCLPAAELAGASLPAAELAQVERLDGRGGAMLWKDSAGAYHLSHPSIGEFLIAMGLDRGALQSGKKRIPATALMIRFLLQGRGLAIEWRALDLSSATLAGATCTDANFSGALLSSARLADAVFTRSVFDNADLKFAEARGAKFVEASFKASNAAHTRAAAASFDRCRFTQASLADAALAGASFEGCTIENTSFADADLSGAAFSKCEITACNFSGADLSKAAFRDCTIDGLKLDRCSLAGATFANTKPSGLSLAATDFRGADLDQGLLSAIKDPQAAAWDGEAAKRLRFSSSTNTQNGAAIDRDVTR